MVCVKVQYRGKEVGEAQILPEGLYYRIQCACKAFGTGVYRLLLHSDTHSVDLGIGIPSGGSLLWDTRIAVKRVGVGELSFCLSMQMEQAQRDFVPVLQDQPFEPVVRLAGAKYEVRNGIPGLLLLEK